MPGVRDIRIRFSGDATGLTRAARDGEQSVGRFSDRTQKVAKAALVGVAAFGAGMVAALKGGVQGLQEGEEAEARFADAISRSTPKIRGTADAFKSYAEQIQRNTRFTYEDTLAVGSLLAAQDGMQKAIRNGTTTLQGATDVVLNMATAQGVDAATAAKTYARAMAAPEKAAGLLRKAGVNLTTEQQKLIKSTVESGNAAQAQTIIQEELRQKFEGSAKAAGETTAGQLARAQNAFGEVQEQLAVGLIPVITDLMAWLVKVTAWAQDNPGKVKLVVIVLGSLAAIIGTVSLAITAWTAITRTATAVQAAWNFVMAANPLVLVTLAVIALVAAIVLIATKTTWFQRLWSAAMNTVKSAISGAFNWIKSNWPTLLAILTGPVGLAVLAIVRHKDRILGALRAIPDGARRIFSGLADILTAPFRAAVDGLRSAWNSTIGGKGISIPKIDLGFTSIGGGGFSIPYLARGGTAHAGLAHIVGEEGPELFVPGRTGTVVPNDALGGGGDWVVELHGNQEALEAVVEKVVVRRDRTTKTAVIAGSRRAFA